MWWTTTRNGYVVEARNKRPSLPTAAISECRRLFAGVFRRPRLRVFADYARSICPATMPQIRDDDDHDAAESHRDGDERCEMSRRTWLAIIPILLFALSAAQAQTVVDVAKITCEQFVDLKVAPPDTIAIWLNGYYHGLQRKTIVDAQQLKDQSQNMTTYCLYKGKGGTVTIMEVTEKLLTSDK
jgi:hypothetical protein